ncbi:MAG TPA: hypothetical protein VH878_07680 [Thermodesulfobacteriota bacterium]|jgi:hypothetical protein
MVKKALIIIVSIFVIPILTNITLADNTDITIKGVISNPKYYDGKRITVEGKVEQVHHTTSLSGDPYTLFRLHDGDHNEIGVYSKGNLSITEGDKIRVTGIFKKEKRAVFLKFKNVIKAKQVEEIG